MSYVKFWAHAVWGTKYHRPVLADNFRPVLFEHIRENAKKKNIYLDTINGYMEHVHCLISLEPKQNIADVIQLLKGESSIWTGRHPDITTNHTLQRGVWNGWADEYCTISVSPSHVNRVRNYIRNQEAHHRKMTFHQEWERFVKESGFEVRTDGGLKVPA